MKPFLRWLAIIAMAAALIVAGTDLIIEVAFPPKKLAPRMAAELSRRLSREVKLKSAAAGFWRGLRLEGLSVSEAGGAAAGTFLEAGEFRAGFRLLPLLMGRLTVDEVELTDWKVQIARLPDGRFNFSDLLGGAAPSVPAPPPPSRTAAWASKAGDLLTAAASKAMTLDVRKARLRHGEVAYTEPGTGWSLVAADVSAWGQGRGPAGPVELRVDFKAKGVSDAQPMEFEASAEARARLEAWRPRASSGRLVLSRIRHPNIKSERFKAEWDIKGLDPFPATIIGRLLGAEGVVHIEGAPGELLNPAGLAKQSEWAALLFYPVEVLAGFRGLGLPDLKRIPYQELLGDYSLKDGSLNLAPLYFRGPILSFNAEGVMSLKRASVGLKANLVMGKTAIGVHVRGPLEKPQVEPDLSFRGPPGTYQTTEQALGQAGNIIDGALPGPAPKPRPVRKKSLQETIDDAGSLVDEAFK